MPPQGLKGTGKKSGAAQRPRSRNQTPRPPPTAADESAYLDIPLAPIQHSTYDELIVQTPGSVIPNTAAIDALVERARSLLNSVEQRGIMADKAMRKLAGMRSLRVREIEQESYEEEKRERARIEEEEERGRIASKMKKRKDVSRGAEERPLAHGAHGLAAQDGLNLFGELSFSDSQSLVTSLRYCRWNCNVGASLLPNL
jgi:transcriptional adapter 3